jgi:hypothetical protein
VVLLHTSQALFIHFKIPCYYFNNTHHYLHHYETLSVPYWGINCLKRVALAIILAIIPRHNAEMGLLAVEVVYALIRICTEGAHTNALLAVIYCEEILIIVCYIVMTYHNVQILTITVLTIVVVTAICALIYGLSEIMYRTCAKMMLLPKGLMIESAAKESPMDTERLIRPPRSDNNQ